MIFTPLASSSHGNAYLLEDGASRILIECGVPYRRLQKLLGFSTSKLDGCLLSHEHKDHARCHLELLKDGVPVYASEGTAEALECKLLSRLPYTETEDGYQELAVGGFDVLPFPTFHDAAEPVGYLVRSRADGEKLMFATDTVNLGYRFKGLNLVALECNYSEDILARATHLPEKVVHRIQNSHMEVGRACAYLGRMERSGLRRIYLLHLSDACSNEGLFVDLVERVCPGIQVVACAKEQSTERGDQHAGA